MVKWSDEFCAVSSVKLGSWAFTSKTGRKLLFEIGRKFKLYQKFHHPNEPTWKIGGKLVKNWSKKLSKIQINSKTGQKFKLYQTNP